MSLPAQPAQTLVICCLNSELPGKIPIILALELAFQMKLDIFLKILIIALDRPAWKFAMQEIFQPFINPCHTICFYGDKSKRNISA